MDMRQFKLFKPIGLALSYIKYKRDRLRLERLMAKGLRVGKNVYFAPDVMFDSGYPFLIEIEDNCRISQGVIILTHDASTFRHLGVTRIAPVKILEGSYIGMGAIILPGVTIGPRALVAAGSVVNRNIGEGKIAAGNPARPYGNYADLLKTYSDNVKSAKVFKKEDIEKGIITSNDIVASMEKNPLAFVRGIPKQDPYYINTNMDHMRKTALRDYDDLMKSLLSTVAASETVGQIK